VEDRGYVSWIQQCPWGLARVSGVIMGRGFRSIMATSADMGSWVRIAVESDTKEWEVTQ
jgi:hypothetical protein